jgi:hypothetical protein
MAKTKTKGLSITKQDAKILGLQVAMENKFCRVAPNKCKSPVRNFVLVASLSLQVIREHLDFWKTCAPCSSLHYIPIKRNANMPLFNIDMFVLNVQTFIEKCMNSHLKFK